MHATGQSDVNLFIKLPKITGAIVFRSPEPPIWGAGDADRYLSGNDHALTSSLT
jgi:hypothetical protein